jgi:NAD(P)-dependent dehydrogenase (short-subunit alcohol dehydrogenase family)
MPSILITGANRGLGLEFARQYAAAGWQVYAGCRKPAAADALQRIAAGGNVKILQLDVADAASVRDAAAAVGDAAIDILLNVAGIAGKPNQRIGNVDYDSWRRVLEVNTLGPMRVVEAFVDNVARGGGKLIVTITSGMGSLADNTSGGSIAYRTSKAAVNMLTRSLAIDLRPRGIACLVVNPGWVRTDMGGPNATLTPEQSVSAMRRLFDGFGIGDTGKFYNWNGREYPW